MTGALVWFRRDLRDFDNAALAAALHAHDRVHCAFVFDRTILDALPSRSDRRVAFIRASLVELDAALRARGGALVVLHDHAQRAIPALARALAVEEVFCNRDYEPAARERDAAVERALRAHGIAFHALKDHVVLDTDEVMTQGGRPYAVFTPYRNAWLKRLTEAQLSAHPIESAWAHLAAPVSARDHGVPELSAIGFEGCDLHASGVEPGMDGGRRALEQFMHRIDAYADARDFPAQSGTSRLSVHLRFGTVSIRELARAAHTRAERGSAGAGAWRNELAWREFYSQLLWHYPRVVDDPFRLEYRRVRFRDDEAAIRGVVRGTHGLSARGCRDARAQRDGLDAQPPAHGDRELPREGPADRLAPRGALLRRRLLDYELASNNGGWQWAASTGCDAQPWFRIFNPVTQSERFDPEGTYIRSRVPALAALDASEIHAPWRVPPALPRSEGHPPRPHVPGTDRGPRARARAHAAGVRGGENRGTATPLLRVITPSNGSALRLTRSNYSE